MLADIILSANEWHNLYQESGFPVGTGLLIYNKSISSVLVWDGETQPAPSARNGAPLNFDDPTVIDENSLGCWVYSMGQIVLCVQEMTS